jgi:thiol-disulfide isomerase/thioredoxin
MSRWIKVIGLGWMLMAGQAGAFVLETSQGPYDLKQHAGKWVVVNYWATWCPPCLEEIPQLEFFHDAHKDTDAVVIGVNYEKIKSAALKDFMDTQMMTYPNVHQNPTPSGETPFGRSIRGLPTTVMISPKGEVKAFHTGQVDGEMLEKFIARHTQ